MKIILTKNTIIGLDIKPSGSVLSVPGDITEPAASALIEMGMAIPQDPGEVQPPSQGSGKDITKSPQPGAKTANGKTGAKETTKAKAPGNPKK